MRHIQQAGDGQAGDEEDEDLALALKLSMEGAHADGGQAGEEDAGGGGGEDADEELALALKLSMEGDLESKAEAAWAAAKQALAETGGDLNAAGEWLRTQPPDSALFRGSASGAAS